MKSAIKNCLFSVHNLNIGNIVIIIKLLVFDNNNNNNNKTVKNITIFKNKIWNWGIPRFNVYQIKVHDWLLPSVMILVSSVIIITILNHFQKIKNSFFDEKRLIFMKYERIFIEGNNLANASWPAPFTIRIYLHVYQEVLDIAKKIWYHNNDLPKKLYFRNNIS